MAGHLRKCQSFQSQSCDKVDGEFNCTECDRKFSSKGGRTQHLRTAHPEAYNNQLPDPVEWRKKWTKDEMDKLATEFSRVNGRSKQEKIRKINHLFPHRSHESIRNVLKSVYFKRRLGEIREERPSCESALESEPMDLQASGVESTSLNPTNTKITSPVTPYIKSLISDILNELSAKDEEVEGVHVLNDISRRILQGQEVDFDKEMAKLLRKIFPKSKGKFVRKRISWPPKTKRESKIKEFKDLQEAWKIDSNRAASHVLDGSPLNATFPSRETIFDFYSHLFSKKQVNISCLDNSKKCDSQINYGPFCLTEIYQVIKGLRLKVAPGPDGITTDMIRKVQPAFYLRLFNLWYLLGKTPKCLKLCKSILIPKGQTISQDINKWRPITIGSLLLRVYCKLWANRLKPELNKKQKAFQQCEGVMENLVLLNSIFQTSRSERRDLCMVFVDIAKAFDTVQHEVVWWAMNRFGIKIEFLEVLKDLYANVGTQFKAQNGRTKTIKMEAGVKQGCPLSPIIFNMVLDGLLDSLNKEDGYSLHGKKINALAFADDLVLVGFSYESLQRLLRQTEDYLNQAGFKINVMKCKSIVVQPVKKGKTRKLVSKPLYINDEQVTMLSPRDKISYLGCNFSYTGKVEFSLDKVKMWCNKIIKARLKTEQKIELTRKNLIPRLSYLCLVSNSTTKRFLVKCDRIIKRMLKHILHLPPGVHDAWWYLPIKCGGLGLQNLFDNVVKRKLCLISRMSLVEDETILCCIQSAWWQKNLNKWRKWIHYSDDLCLNDIALFFKKRIENLQHRLWKSDQGHGIDQVTDSSHSCHWLWGKSAALKGNKFIKAFKLLSNNLPVKVNLHRGKKNSNLACRLCQEKAETQPHILQSCGKLADIITKRHNTVMNSLAEFISDNDDDWEVLKERKFKDQQGCRWKPDLVVINKTDKLGFILDLHVPYETRRQNLNICFETKAKKYECLTNIIKTEFNLEKVSPMGFVIGARGGWCRRQDPFCKKLNISVKKRKYLCELAVMGSIKIWEAFSGNLRLRDARF